MYRPASFQVTDAGTLNRFIRDHPFATLISSTADGPFITHLPLELLEQQGENTQSGHLVGHVARANPHWQHFDPKTPSVAIFHGPHAYISPSWYVSDSLPPTWNYAVVHARGHPRVIEDAAHVRQTLETLVKRHEQEQSQPWAKRLDPALMKKLQAGIVAFEFRIDEIHGKFKLGQNRTPADQAASLAGLSKATGRDSGALASFVRSFLDTENP